MFKRFVDLKKHYGTETMIEVVLDADRRSELTDRPLYKDGRVIRMFFSKEDGLVAYDYNSLGIGVIRKVNETYLEALTITCVDFAAVTGNNAKDKVRIDSEAIIEGTKDNKDKSYKDDILGITVIVGLSVLAFAGAILRNGSTDPIKDTPKPKTSRR